MLNIPFRIFCLLAGLALLLAAATACGEDSSPARSIPTTTNTGAGAPGTTTTAAPTTTAAWQTTTAPETTTTTSPTEFRPAVVAYRYLSHGDLEYAIALELRSVVEMDGGPPGGPPPGAIDVEMRMAGTVSYLTSPGPEEGTFSVRIVSDLETVESGASMGGITLPDSELGDIAGLETPIDITVVVDERGDIVEVSSAALDGMMAGMDSLLGASGGIQDLNRPFGPAFPDREVGLGDSWTEETVQEGPGGPIVTSATHRVVTVEGPEDAPLLVVASEYRTEAFEWDMSEMVSAMAGAFIEEESVGAEEILSGFSLVIEVAPAVTTATSRFDVREGVVIDGSYQASGMITTRTTAADESGEPFTLTGTNEFHQEVFYELIDQSA